MYVTAEEIIKEFQLKPKEFGFNDEETAQTELENLVTKWILQATNAIDKYLYLEKSYIDGHVPGIVSLACTECVGNILMNRRLRQDGAYIRSDNWTKDVAPLDIMDGVRELLDPLTQGKQRRSLARIEVYAVTGEDDEDEEVN
jgi:hypothetical protein